MEHELYLMLNAILKRVEALQEDTNTIMQYLADQQEQSDDEDDTEENDTDAEEELDIPQPPKPRFQKKNNETQ